MDKIIWESTIWENMVKDLLDVDIAQLVSELDEAVMAICSDYLEPSDFFDLEQVALDLDNFELPQPEDAPDFPYEQI